MADIENMFDDHPSLSASLESIEDQHNRPPMFGLPSQHSGFKSEPSSDVEDDLSNGEPWSPPGFSGHKRSGSGWFRHDPYGEGNRLNLKPSLSPQRSRHTSPEYQDAEEGDEDLTIPANIPLPRGTESPLKGRSPSPERKVPVAEMLQDVDGMVQPDVDKDEGIAENPSNCTSTL